MFRMLLARVQSHCLEVLADLELVSFGALGVFLVLAVPRMPKPLSAAVLLLSLAFVSYGALDLWRMLRARSGPYAPRGGPPPSA